MLALVNSAISSVAAGQSTPAAAPIASVDIHYAGPGIVAPVLLPNSDSVTAPDQCKKFDGKVTLLVVVDDAGRPWNVYFFEALGNELDLAALNAAEQSRFKPGTLNGKPAVVAVRDEVKVPACVTKQKDDDGRKQFSYQLRSAPEQRIEAAEAPELTPPQPLPETPPGKLVPLPAGVYHIGPGVSPPKMLRDAAPDYTKEAKVKRVQGSCLVQFIVDEHGLPQNPRVVKSAVPGLEDNAVKAVRNFRFMPAMHNGEPVSVMITAEVNFRLY